MTPLLRELEFQRVLSAVCTPRLPWVLLHSLQINDLYVIDCSIGAQGQKPKRNIRNSTSEAASTLDPHGYATICTPDTYNRRTRLVLWSWRKTYHSPKSSSAACNPFDRLLPTVHFPPKKPKLDCRERRHRRWPTSLLELFRHSQLALPRRLHQGTTQYRGPSRRN